MKRIPLLVLALPSLLVAGCTESGSREVPETRPPSTTSTSTQPSTTTSTIARPTVAAGEQNEPPEFTEFTSSTTCDPDADDANLQVIQAFVTAYNDRDESRLTELASESVTVDDLNGIPHLGEDNWTGVTAWASEGWNVDDQFELTSLVMYDGGSVFEVNRSNEVLRANRIEKLHHTWKAHSSNCVISHMVLYLPFGDVGASECRYWEAFADELAAGTTQTLNPPEVCSE
jgi:hypothetical protein